MPKQKIIIVYYSLARNGSDILKAELQNEINTDQLIKINK